MNITLRMDRVTSLFYDLEKAVWINELPLMSSLTVKKKSEFHLEKKIALKLPGRKGVNFDSSQFSKVDIENPPENAFLLFLSATFPVWQLCKSGRKGAVGNRGRELSISGIPNSCPVSRSRFSIPDFLYRKSFRVRNKNCKLANKMWEKLARKRVG